MSVSFHRRKSSRKPVFAAIACATLFSNLVHSEGKSGFEGMAWKTGQVLATSEMSFDPSTFFFETGTGSRYGHIGVIVAPETGATLENTFVYESTPPFAKKTPLLEYLERAAKTEAGAIEATLLEPIRALTAKESKTLVKAMNDVVKKGTPYNFSVVMSDGSLNCSEFVRKAFTAIGREAGVIEKFSDMNLRAFDGKLLPLFGKNAAPDAHVVTPVAIVQSPELRVVKANLPVGSLMSEAEIYAIWKKRGGLRALSDLMGIPMSTLAEIEPLASNKPYRTFPAGWRLDSGGCVNPLLKKRD